MTINQIQLVQSSWEKVKPIADEAGEYFYQQLFAAAPQVRPMFREDIRSQAIKLSAMLTYVVSRLDRLDTIMDDIRKLAVNHNRYGAQPAHYAVVGECLIATLKHGLGNDWNPELEDAWTTAYGILSGAMITAQLEAESIRA